MIIQPQPKQEEFLTTEADIALYGGAAGGGKSFALLLCSLSHIDNSKFNAVCFRRSMVEIRNQGGLWDESMGIYPHVHAHPRQQYLDWTFPTGAVVKFAHLENDSTVYNWQGGQINLLMFDELTHFTQHQFFYMLSRNRSVSGIRPYIRMTTNPDKDSWVRKFIDWYIGDDGFPITERSGVIRWFVRHSGEILWADTADELRHIAEPKSFTFISAKLSDNQILMQKDPGYLANLMAQNHVERSKLLDGNWNISYSDYGAVLNRADFMRYEYTTNHKGEQVFPVFERTYFVVDSATKTKEANDYSVVGYWGKCRYTNEYYIIDWFRGKLESPDLEQKIIDMWNKWHWLSPQGIWIEDTLHGTSLIQHLKKVMPAFELIPIKDKFLRLNDGLGIIKAKHVYIPSQAQWIDQFIEECECFRADGEHVLMDKETHPHDDQVDVLAYAIGNQITMKHTVSVYIKPKTNNKRSYVYD